MRYLLLVYDEGERESRRGFHVSADPTATARLISSEELQPVATATTVRVRDGDTVVADGPCDGTNETLGGYYLIEGDSLDEAIEWASRIPAAGSGTIEIRPVLRDPEHGG